MFRAKIVHLEIRIITDFACFFVASAVHFAPYSEELTSTTGCHGIEA